MRLLSDKDLVSKLPTPHLVGLDETVTWQDLFVVANPKYDDSEREIAAQWIGHCWLRRPIAPQRWAVIGRAVMEELAARARANGTHPEIELKASVVTALFLSAKEAVDFSDPGPRKAFWRRLNNLVVEDLLGTEWRKHRATDEIDGLEEFQIEAFLADKANHHSEVEIGLDVERIVARARLGTREAQVINAILQGEATDKTAARLGVNPGAVRTAHSRALKKIKEATGAM